MYATQVTVRIEPGHEEEARQGLMERVLPEVKGTPGNVGGYWLESVDNRGASLVLWDTKEHAEAVADLLRSGTAEVPPDVTIESIEVREVIASV